MKVLLKSVFALLGTALLINVLAQQNYSPTVKIPVIFYEYHSDLTCPEFEVNNTYSVERNMVMSNVVEWDKLNANYFGLDSIMKMVYNPANIRHNRYIKYWFRPWARSAWTGYTFRGAQGDSTIPNYWDNYVTRDYSNIAGYHRDGRPNTTNPIVKIGTDTSFKNIVYKDSLEFRHIGNGKYEFVDPAFFPLDGRPFGHDVRRAFGEPSLGSQHTIHNYSFAMELHWEFDLKPGLTFNFTGDDDVWAFVDGRRVMDLGGLHVAESDSFNVDTLNLSPAKRHVFSLFYCERRAVDATIQIQTNIIQKRPDTLYMEVKPNDTIRVGETATVNAVIYSKDGAIVNLPGQFDIGWEEYALEDPSGSSARPINPESSFVKSGKTLTFTPTEAYVKVKVWGIYLDPNLNVSLKDTVTIMVLPGPATHLVVESSADSLRSLRNNDPLSNVRISNSETFKDNFYAILRDAQGNWVGASNPTNWSSAKTSVATAQRGAATSRGQGRANRVAQTNDSALVTATDSAKGFSDGVMVILDNVTYDQIRFVVKDAGQTFPVEQLLMRTDKDSSLFIQGFRSDTKVWQDAPANWTSSGVPFNLGVPTLESDNWRNFRPTTTGTAIIIARRIGTGGKSIADTVRIIVSHGPPNSIDLYNAEGDPKSPTVKLLPDTIFVQAGVDTVIVAKVFDNLKDWLEEFEKVDSLRNRIKWTLTKPDQATATLTPLTLTGHKVTFHSDDAWWDYTVSATYEYGSIKLPPSVVVVRVIPGPPAKLYIEPNEKGRVNSPNSPQLFPSNTMTITAEETFQNAYAVLRDKSDNFVYFSNPTDWSSADGDIVTVKKGLESLGQGIVNRNPSALSGTTKVTAKDTKTGFTATLDVQILAYYYKKIKIVVKNPDTLRINNLTMDTNQDTTLFAIGQRSDDTTKWEPVSLVDWKSSSNLKIDPVAQSGSSWHFSPIDTGRGWIAIQKGSVSDTVPVVFTPGKPIKVDITILTPPSELIAGDTILVLVKITNKDGLVPGPWCYSGDSSAVYSDPLGKGPVDKDPVIITGEGAGVLNTALNMSNTVNECFMGGLDTVKVVLYYAPYRNPTDPIDTLHRITTNLNGLTASTDPFILLPGDVHRIQLENATGKHLEGTYTLHYPLDAVLIYSVGYDEYGNRRGRENSNWGTNGTLHPLTRFTGVSQYYDASTVSDDESGLIFAHVGIINSGAADSTGDSLNLVIQGPPSAISAAFTRDLDGDAYLDAIDITFNKRVSPSELSTDNVAVSSGLTKFKIREVISLDNTNSLQYRVVIEEDSTKKESQTALLPSLTITNVPSLGENTVAIICTDGAGPVIWSVTKEIKDLKDRTQDIVRVTFSEKIQGPGGNNFVPASVSPHTVFFVYHKNTANDSFEKIGSMFENIKSFSKFENDSTLVFSMTNNHDLNMNHFININTDPKMIYDKKTNSPVVDNRKVKVIVSSRTPTEIIVVPNPSTPTFEHVPPGKLEFVHVPEARKWVSSEGKGTVISFKVSPPKSETDSYEGFLKIYDAVGNMVFLTRTEKFLKYNPASDSSSMDFDIYWNGSNQKGMKVAPGVYKVIVFLKMTTKEGRKQLRFPSIVGIVH